MVSSRSGARTNAPPRSTPRFTIPAAGLLLLFSIGCSGPTATPNASEWRQLPISGETMGTIYHVKIVVPSEENPDPVVIKGKIDSGLSDFNELLSTWDPESELSRFNQHASTEPFPVSPQTLEVVQAALDIYSESGGAFDPSISPLIDLWGFGSQGRHLEPPSPEEIAATAAVIGMNHLSVEDNALVKEIPELQLNLSAIAKGYGVDIITEILLKEGFDNLMVEIGGEVVVRGKNLKRKPWTIGVDSPIQTAGRRNLIETLSLEDCAVATSGDYRNAFEHDGKLFSHIIDPKTGWPIPESVKSVTVIAPTCMLADGAATAIMAMGAEDGFDWAENREDLEAMIFVRDDEEGFERLQTSGMEKYLAKN